MSRDNIGLKLNTLATKDNESKPVIVLLHHMVAIHEEKEYTDIELSTGTKVRVRESIAAILQRTDRYGALKIDKE